MPQLRLNPHPPDDALCERLKQPALLNSCSTPKQEPAALTPKGLEKADGVTPCSVTKG